MDAPARAAESLQRRDSVLFLRVASPGITQCCPGLRAAAVLLRETMSMGAAPEPTAFITESINRGSAAGRGLGLFFPEAIGTRWARLASLMWTLLAAQT